MGQDSEKKIFNDLESVAVKECPEIVKVKASLLSNGASAALMTGSGSAVFGIYNNIENAKRAYKNISQNRIWKLYLTQLIV